MAPALEASAGAVGVERRLHFGVKGFPASELLPWLCISLSLAACSGRSSYADHQRLEIQVPTEIVELDPRFATRGLDVKASRLIHAGLVALDNDTLLPHPSLARALSLVGERTIAIELEATIRFHSGRQLEANDVCATISALKDPELLSPHKAVVAAFSRCRALDSHHLELDLAYPRATWMTDLEVPILRADQARLPRGHATELDGLGPFSIIERSQSELLLQRSSGVRDGVVQRVSIRTVRDENARVLRLLAGQADVTANATSPALLAELARSGKLAVTSRPGANVTYLLVNNDRAPFTGASTRRALSLAIDRQAIIERLLNNHAQAARWIFPQNHWACPSDLALPVFDQSAAAQQLRGKGPVTLLTSPDRSRLTLARVIAQMLGDAGLPTEVIPLDLGVMLSRLDAGNFTLAVLQIPELTEPNLLSWFFHPRAIPGEGADGRNRARYRSARAGELLDEAAASFDREVRRRLYGELAHQMMTDMPVVPLWHEDQIAVLAKRVAGFRLSAAGRWDALSNTELR